MALLLLLLLVCLLIFCLTSLTDHTSVQSPLPHSHIVFPNTPFSHSLWYVLNLEKEIAKIVITLLVKFVFSFVFAFEIT